MKTKLVLIVSFAAVLGLCGCSTIRRIEPSVRSEASFTVVPTPTYIAMEAAATTKLGGELNGFGQIGFVDHSRTWVTAEKLKNAKGETFYTVVALNDILTNPTPLASDASKAKDRRNQVAGVLLTASDHNADVWLSRVFNNKTSAETTKGILNDLFIGTGAVVAKTHSALTAGLNVGSIVFSKSLENIDKNFFANQGYLAMESVIRSRRRELSDRISTKLKNLSYEEYRIDQVLRDIQELDEASSLKAGLRELQRKANDEAATVKIAPSLSTQLVGKTAAVGATTTLSVVAAGTEPLNYTWYRAGEKIADASGSSLSLSSVQQADFGPAFAVLVTSPYGSVMSNVVRLTAAPAP